MIKKIFFYVLFLSFFIGEAQAKENIINSDIKQIINYKNSDVKIRDLIENKSLYFESNTGSINCDGEKCLLDTSGIYEGEIKVNTKIGEKILKIDYYKIDKSSQIANLINFRTNKIISKNTEVIYSYAKLSDAEKEFIKNGKIFITTNNGKITCQNEVCFIDTKNINFGDVSIKIKSGNRVFKEIVFKIKKFTNNLDISNKFKYKSIQKYDLSCEISAASDILSTISGKKITEDELLEKIDKSSFWDKKAVIFNGQRLWGNPEDGFVGAINNALQSKYTGYGVLEKPIQRLYYKYGVKRSTINKFSYVSGYGQTEHLRELFSALHKGNFVQLWGDYLTNPTEEDGLVKGKISQEQSDKGLSGTNYTKTWNIDRRIYWNYMKDSKLYEHVGLIGEHAFYLLGYEGSFENPSKIIVWDTKTGKHKYSMKEWWRKWNLMQNRSLVIEGN